MKSLKLFALFLMVFAGSQAFAGHAYSSNLDYKARVLQSNARTLLYTLNRTHRFYGVKRDLRQLIFKTQRFRQVMRYRYSKRQQIRALNRIKSEFYQIQRRLSFLNRHYGPRHGYRYGRLWRVKRAYNRFVRSFYRFNRTATRVVYNRYYRYPRYGRTYP